MGLEMNVHENQNVMKHILLFLLFIMTLSLSSAQETCFNFCSTPTADGHLYFTSNRDSGVNQIFRCKTDGTDVEQLTHSPLNKYNPIPSPDGQQVVFQMNPYGSDGEVYLMNADGSGMTNLTNNDRYDGNPTFSPDGTKILFDAWDGSNYPEVFIMNTDGTDRTQITNKPGAYWQSAPLFHPGGQKIYFLQGLNANNHIVMMDTDGNNWVDITEENVFGTAEIGMHFNADGSKMVFSTTEWLGYNNGCDIVIADADGSNWERITTAQDKEYFYIPFFHPTLPHIFYTYNQNANTANWEIWRMDITGDDPTKISNCLTVDTDDPTLGHQAHIMLPNPAVDQVFVDLRPGEQLLILDLTGRVVYQGRESVIHLGGLSRGVYMVLISDKYGSMTDLKKLVLTH